jgi:hypothetical protein
LVVRRRRVVGVILGEEDEDGRKGMTIPSLKESMQLSALGAGEKKARGFRGKEAVIAGGGVGVVVVEVLDEGRREYRSIIVSPASAKQPLPTLQCAARQSEIKRADAAADSVAVM